MCGIIHIMNYLYSYLHSYWLSKRLFIYASSDVLRLKCLVSPTSRHVPLKFHKKVFITHKPLLVKY